MNFFIPCLVAASLFLTACGSSEPLDQMAGAQAELDNVALYDSLLASVSDPGMRDVFERLQAMSRDRHLPAFRRFAGG